jgi:two-component system nitrogen regulation response regulator GlnG
VGPLDLQRELSRLKPMVMQWYCESQGMSTKRDDLLSRLESLLPAQFEQVLFHLRIPSAQLSGANAPQGIRAIEALRHLENTGELATLEALLSSDGETAAVRIVLAQPPAVAKPVPVYPDAEVEALSKRLEDARARREKLRSAGVATGDVDREILELRRHLREGGQLRAGDALSDGRYLLVRVVGRGGFAVVWEAYDQTAQQPVAIKVLHANLAGDPQRRERFFRGAQAMAKLRHPGVVRVLESKGEDGGFYYFVMEFVPGGNLREAVLARRLKRDDVLPLILQIGEALALAHSRGMVHRDIKPANILLDEGGNARLTDFDLVGAHDTTGGTRTGALGTVIYAAPECLDKPQEATARADVYGLGMTAIFCLCGRDLSMDVFRDPDRLISKLDCSISTRDVLRRAVAWEPSDRFADAASMMPALRNAWSASDRGEVFELLSASMVSGRTDLPSLVPTLTIVSHPLGDRVGKRCRLHAVVAGHELSLSPTAPEFASTGPVRGVLLENLLEDLLASQSPIRFAPGLDGGICIMVDPGGTPVRVNSRSDAKFAFTREEITNGVALELAERVGLLLHMDDCTIEDAAGPFGMVGASAGMRGVRTAILQVVDLAMPVLIRGETGTGKELVARAIHNHGPRRGGPFVSVNLGAVPRELAAATLFGAMRGAYTGATRNLDGLFRTAHGGTLFLDEIGEAPPEIQVALLRALDTGEIYPVGADKPVAVQVRLIAATNVNLEHQTKQGEFKAPLLHRLAGYEVRIPPLRERREDIGPLFYHFAREELETIGEADRLSPQDPYARPWLPAPIAAQLVRHRWPGNIRELRNLTRQLVIGSRGLPQLQLDPRIADELSSKRAATSRAGTPPRAVADPGNEPPGPRPPPGPAQERRAPSDVTEAELREALPACEWDLKATADLLRISRASIYDLIAKYPDIRTAGDLAAEEIVACFRTCDGDLYAMAAQLKVSKRALSRRVYELGLISHPRSPTR